MKCLLVAGALLNLCWASETVPFDGGAGQAEKTFAEFGSSIYQVRIINIKSQNLNSSGSGFYVAEGQLFATNYHVVSSVVLEPEEYKAVVEMEGNKVELDVVAIDVVNDLALLRIPVSGTALKLRDSIPAKGEKMFSIGNPHNIGMTIVEGNYNGLADDYVFDRIHFSGALNPGMSGGPTLDDRGRVVGINVQTAGNQVGFLVPVEKLAELITLAKEAVSDTTEPENASNTNVYKQLQLGIGEQILNATAQLIDEMDASEWPQEELAEGMVVGRIHPGFHCWGQSNTNDKDKITTVTKGCNSRQSIFVSRELSSGYLEYEYQFMTAEKWPESAFYKYASREFSRGRPPNRAGEDDVENFSCINDVIERGPGVLERKAAYCSRPYKKYPGMYDVFYMAVSTQEGDRMLMEHFCLAGVSQEKANVFLGKFISRMEWQ